MRKKQFARKSCTVDSTKEQSSSDSSERDDQSRPLKRRTKTALAITRRTSVVHSYKRKRSDRVIPRLPNSPVDTARLHLESSSSISRVTAANTARNTRQKKRAARNLGSKAVVLEPPSTRRRRNRRLLRTLHSKKSTDNGMFFNTPKKGGVSHYFCE